MKWSLIAGLGLAVAACGAPPSERPNEPPAGQREAPASSGFSAETSAPAPPTGLSISASAPASHYKEVTLPAGTTLRLDLKSSVSSDSSRVEDPVRATLRQPVRVDGAEVLPTGTELVGTVTGAERSGRVKGRASISYRFDALQHDGERYAIRTSPLTHVAEATKGEDATKIAIGAGAGAAVGAILGGGSGAAKGAAIGGAGGTGMVLATRGKEVRLGPGADVTTRLTAPLTVRVKVAG